MSNPFACRFCNTNPRESGIPPNHQWGSGSYGNTSTEDYFSESFSHMIYPNQSGPSYTMPAGIQEWLDEQILDETLPLVVPFGTRD